MFLANDKIPETLTCIRSLDSIDYLISYVKHQLTTKVKFILSSISSGLEFWSVNHISVVENSEFNFLKDITFFSEISDNWPINLFKTSLYKTLESCW